MKERSPSSSLDQLKQDIERFDGKEPAEHSPQNVNVSGGDAAMRVGLELVLSVLLLGGGGYFLDSWLGSTPWLMVLGLFLGFIAGFRMIISTTNPPKT